MDPIQLLGFIGVIGLILLILFAHSVKEKQLIDPDNKQVVFLDEVTPLAKLAGPGRYLIRIYRQSGNIHSEHGMHGSASQALQRALATFRRAKIDSVAIRTNTETTFYMVRLHHNDRGSMRVRRLVVQKF